MRHHAYPSSMVGLIVQQIVPLVRIAAVTTDVAPPQWALLPNAFRQALREKHKWPVVMACPPAYGLESGSNVICPQQHRLITGEAEEEDKSFDYRNKLGDGCAQSIHSPQTWA
jgi:hypothetical protein